MPQDLKIQHGEDLLLPLRQGPVRFAVLMPDGRTSNAWRVWTEESGAYICCRDNMGGIKVSLHRSGQQHIAFRQETGVEMGPGDRFWNRWHEPPQQSPAISSFRLVFPPWGVRLGPGDRAKTDAIARKWGKNQILIDGDDEFLTIVSFAILDDSVHLNFVGDHPHTLFGLLPFRHGKSLFVIAGREPTVASSRKWNVDSPGLTPT